MLIKSHTSIGNETKILFGFDSVYVVTLNKVRREKCSLFSIVYRFAMVSKVLKFVCVYRPVGVSVNSMTIYKLCVIPPTLAFSEIYRMVFAVHILYIL